MARQILVPLKKNDRLGQVIPYIEKIAKPGMTVVFLIHSPLAGALEWSRDPWVTGEFSEEDLSWERRISKSYSLEDEQTRLDNYQVFLVQEALRRRGVEIVVDVYRGRLRKVVEEYRRKGDVELIMMRTEGAHWHFRFLQKTMSFFGLKRHDFSAMLLLHPGAVA